MQFDRIPSYSNIQKMVLPKEYVCYGNVPNIYFRPFNYYENWARQLWGLYSVENGYGFKPLFNRPLTMTVMDGKSVADSANSFVHLVIAGFNRMGRSLFLEALRVCHYPNYDDTVDKSRSVRTKITLIDRNMDEMLPYFKAQFPYLDSQIFDIDINYMNADISSKQVRDYLVGLASDKDCMPTIAICVSDPDMSLSLGLNLPSEIYEKEVSVLIRQEIQTDLGRLINSDSGRFKNVKIFGMLDQGMSMSLLGDELPAYVNQMYKCSYCKNTPGKEDKSSNDYCSIYGTKGCKLFVEGSANNHYMLSLCKFVHDEPEYAARMKECAYDAWFTLSEVYRWANRYQIDAYVVYCRTLGYEIFKGEVGKEWEEVSYEDFEKRIDEGYLRTLMRMEKYRWNAERTIEGWRYGEVRNNTYLVHNLILPYNELEKKYPQEIGKDEDVIRNIPYILKLGGYKIYRKITL